MGPAACKFCGGSGLCSCGAMGALKTCCNCYGKRIVDEATGRPPNSMGDIYKKFAKQKKSEWNKCKRYSGG